MLVRGEAWSPRLLHLGLCVALLASLCPPAGAFGHAAPPSVPCPSSTALWGRSVGCSRRPVCRLKGGAAGTMMGTKDVQFVTNKMCPFAQKVWVCLEEKKVDYDLVEVGLYGSGGKPDWFMKLNPRGLVPVLKHGNKGVTESNDICRYIDANFGDVGSLSPQGQGVDFWMRLMDGEVLPTGKKMVNGGSNPEPFHQAISKFESNIKGPYLLGDVFSLADVTAAPMMWRIFTESRLGVTPEKYPKTCAWMELVKSRPSFKNTVVSSWWWWW